MLENVSFAYPGTDRLILKDINLTLTSGMTLGLVAENGSGKSTLAKLLCRIYEPTKGRILINGRDLKEFDKEQWQSLVGVMLQEYGHYEHLRIDDAIALGRTSSRNGDKRIIEAASESDATGFIDALPHGYKTTLGRSFEDGVELSGGEYQKLAIARLFYRKPQLAIFDEPTSAIDSNAEPKIFKNIFEGQLQCIKILISHQYYTLRRADSICLIDDGRIVEMGSHDELMAQNGRYAERYRRQASEYVQ